MNEDLLKAIEDLLDRQLEPIKQNLSRIEEKIDRLESKVDVNAEQSNDDVLAMLKTMDQKLNIIQKDVEFTFNKASKNELEINRLKHQ